MSLRSLGQPRSVRVGNNWDEYASADGRPYWVNSETAESQWENPHDSQYIVEEPVPSKSGLFSCCAAEAAVPEDPDHDEKVKAEIIKIEQLNEALEALQELPQGYVEEESPNNGTCLPASLTIAINGLRPRKLEAAQLLAQVKKWVASKSGEEARMVMNTPGGEEPAVSLRKFNVYIDSLSQGPTAAIDWTNIPQTVFNVIIQATAHIHRVNIHRISDVEHSSGSTPGPPETRDNIYIRYYDRNGEGKCGHYQPFLLEGQPTDDCPQGRNSSNTSEIEADKHHPPSVAGAQTHIHIGRRSVSTEDDDGYSSGRSSRNNGHGYGSSRRSENNGDGQRPP